MDTQDLKEQLNSIKDDLDDNSKRMTGIENKLSLFNGIGICLLVCLGIIGYLTKLLYQDLTLPINMLEAEHTENTIDNKKNAWDIQQLSRRIDILENKK